MLISVLYTWGLGTNGQLGHRSFEWKKDFLSMNFYIQSEPRKLMKSKRFARVAIGGSFTLATTHSGELFGWGTDFLNMGKGLQSNEPVLIEVPGGKRIVDVSAGLHHAAVIDENGHLYTWGDGGNWFKGGGQLGHGSRNAETHPRLPSKRDFLFLGIIL